jgi:hypothetical protein
VCECGCVCVCVVLGALEGVLMMFWVDTAASSVHAILSEARGLFVCVCVCVCVCV